MRWRNARCPGTGGYHPARRAAGDGVQVLAPEAYVQIKNLIEKTVASGLIYLNSHARDFKAPELRQVSRIVCARLGRRVGARSG